MHKASAPALHREDPYRPVSMTSLEGTELLIPFGVILHVCALNALYTEVTYVDQGRARQILVLTPAETNIPNDRARRLALERWS